MIRIANVNELPSSEEGFRVLVTRKWPRGIPKDAVDLWVKDLGGNPELLKEYRKGKISKAGFQSCYMAETSEPGRQELILDLQRRALNGKNLILMCDFEEEDGSVRRMLKEVLEAY
ncbi:MAG: DUF488 family protein [Planctomycetota bacterium]